MEKAFAFFDQDPAGVTLSEIPFVDNNVIWQMSKAKRRDYYQKRHRFIEAVKRANEEHTGGGQSSVMQTQVHSGMRGIESPAETTSEKSLDMRQEVSQMKSVEMFDDSSVTMEAKRAEDCDDDNDKQQNDTYSQQLSDCYTMEEIDYSWPEVIDTQSPGTSSREDSCRSSSFEERVSWPENSPDYRLPMPRSRVTGKRAAPDNDVGIACTTSKRLKACGWTIDRSGSSS